MKRGLYLIIIVLAAILSGCTGGDGSKGGSQKSGANRAPLPTDTLYTRQLAMSIYAYQPLQALQIVDSALILGNMSEVQAEQCRARIYSHTQMYDQVDSLLGGPKDIRLDSAQAIGERLLNNDTIKADLKRLRDVMEILVYTDRMQNDTLGWIERSRQLVDVCREMGPEAEADALRTEAEIGAALCAMGQEKEGMAKMDSAIAILNEELRMKNEEFATAHPTTQADSSFFILHSSFKFNELDALIIALKRKIVILGSHNRYAETLPLSRQIIERLDDYEAHPDLYHDGSCREPKSDQKRDDYIRFYRNQAQSYLTAALASLGERGDMLTAFRQIEDGVREATAREHIARYNALQQQVEAKLQQAKADRATLIAVGIGIFALLFLVLAVVVILKNREISRKNRILAQQIADSLNYKELYLQERQTHEPKSTAVEDLNTLSDEQLFQHIHDVIVRERLFLDPKFERQTIMDRFQLSKERAGAVFSKGSEHTKLTNYIQQLRLEYAAKLLVEQPDMSIVQIAAECGFSSHKYFSDRFRLHFSMTPSEFRKARQ